MHDNFRPNSTVLDVWEHVHPRFGGIGPAVGALCRAVTENSAWNIRQFATCWPDENQRADGIPATVETLVPSGPRPMKDFQIAKSIEASIRACDVCHVHGIWSPHAITSRRVASKLKKPVISSAHGMLERGDLANKAAIKAIYSTLFERPSLSKSGCLRALCSQEARDYRDFGLENPIVLIPNGIAPLEPVDVSELLVSYPQLAGKQLVLFLGRVHQKKGILQLAEAWPSVLKTNPDAHLLIAGSEYGDAGNKARALLETARVLSSVTFCGVLNGALKLAALSAARCFCLPSFSEGMSIAVLEALSMGVPVVITPACNVDEVVESGAGFHTSNNPPELSSTLSRLLSLPDSKWQAMRTSGRSLARRRYNWPEIGRDMAAVYDWLVGGPEPKTLFS